MSTPIPILLLGKIPGHMELVKKIVQPEYEIIHSVSSVPDAATYLTSSPSPAPQVGIMGGGFTPADFEQMLQTPEAKDLVWLRPNIPKPEPGQEVVRPSAEKIAKRVRERLVGVQGEVRGGGRRGEVLMF